MNADDVGAGVLCCITAMPFVAVITDAGKAVIAINAAAMQTGVAGALVRLLLAVPPRQSPGALAQVIGNKVLAGASIAIDGFAVVNVAIAQCTRPAMLAAALKAVATVGHSTISVHTGRWVTGDYCLLAA